MRADAESSCIALCTDSWRHWLGSLWSGRSKDLEIIVLRHQLGVLCRQIDRPELTDTDRSLLGAIAAALARPSRAGWLVTPDTLRRFYLLFFIDIRTRTVYFAGITDHPTGVWTTQAARNLLIQHGHQLADAQALVRDRASQFIDAFDGIFRTEGMKILTAPVRTPVANAFAERWIGTLRRELLDRTIIWNRRQPNNLVVDYIDRYNTHRPHRSLDQRPPVATDAADQPDRLLQVVGTARCGGLINEYRNAA